MNGQKDLYFAVPAESVHWAWSPTASMAATITIEKLDTENVLMKEQHPEACQSRWACMGTAPSTPLPAGRGAHHTAPVVLSDWPSAPVHRETGKGREKGVRSQIQT